jgi:hypothetical protein
MQEDTKKYLTIAIAIGGLVIAGAITFMTKKTSHGIESIGSSEKILVKCGDSKCNAQYEMSKRAYYEFLQKNVSPMSPQIPPLTCEKCGKESVYRAIICPSCNQTFFYGQVPNDHKDRCPYCKFSQTEKNRQDAVK